MYPVLMMRKLIAKYLNVFLMTAAIIANSLTTEVDKTRAYSKNHRSSGRSDANCCNNNSRNNKHKKYNSRAKKKQQQ